MLEFFGLVTEYPEQYLSGADVTTLHAAVFKNQLHHVKYHIKCLTKQNISLNFQTKNGDTSLLLACKLPSADDNIPKVLVEAGADVNISDNKKSTPLHAACQNGKVDVVELLLRAGATVNARGGLDSITPLHCAAWAANFKLVELLLDAGADANIKDDSGEIPLLYCIVQPENYDEATVEKLLSVTSDFNCVNNKGNTILIQAVKKNNEKLVSLLIKYDVDVNYNEVAIKKALIYGHTNIFKMLWSASNVEKFNEEYTSFYFGLIYWSWNPTKTEKVECFYEVMNTPGVSLHPSKRYLKYLADILTNTYECGKEKDKLFESKRDSVYEITKQLLKSGAVFLEEDLEGFIKLCRKYHDHNYTEQEIKLLHLLIDNNVDISPHVIYFSVVNYPQFTLTLLPYCVLCDPIDVFKYFRKIKRIIDISLLNLIRNVLRLCSPSEELRFQCFLNIQSLSDSREWPHRGLRDPIELEVPFRQCIRDSEIDYELCEDVLDLLLLNRVPTLFELSRDKVRQHLRVGCVGGTTAYLQNVYKLDVLQILEDIIRCKVIVNV